MPPVSAQLSPPGTAPARAGTSAPLIATFVLSGGIGSRLWPLSRGDNPKQFHGTTTAESMLRCTVGRLRSRGRGWTPVHLIASDRHSERIRDDLAGTDLGGGRLILEPAGRNTAVAVAIATLTTLRAFDDSLVLVVPSDHVISTDAEFWQTVDDGLAAATAGRIVVFGITPTRAETGFGYIEARAAADGGVDVMDVARFVEKPDSTTAGRYLEAGGFYWNAGIFLFRAGAMRDAFLAHQPALWRQAETAFARAVQDGTGLHLPARHYADIPSLSFDRAIMERVRSAAMVPARFRWSDAGSWQSLLEIGGRDGDGNVVIGDVVALDCRNSYLRSEGRLLSAIGLSDMVVISTPDATVVAPVAKSQKVGEMVDQLDRRGRIETRFTPADDNTRRAGAGRDRVRQWLIREALPLWTRAGVDRVHGGFFEALTLGAEPVRKHKRMRTMARQIYAFAVAAERGWSDEAGAIVAHGVDFIARKGRSAAGGWMRTLNWDGTVADGTEDAYDTACVLLALAHAHRRGNALAAALGEQTFAFLDRHLRDDRLSGFLETSRGGGPRRSNPHMHLLEAFLAWYDATGEGVHLERAEQIVELFKRRFFDGGTWTVGEYFDVDWRPAAGEVGQHTEPGHHFEWSALLMAVEARTARTDLRVLARRLYASALAGGFNRTTGLAYASVSRSGKPLETMSRSWPQAEAIKAAIALARVDGPDMTPEIEARVARLFRWHIDAAPSGLWIDRVDERGIPRAEEVPASIFYHLVCAFGWYLDHTAPERMPLARAREADAQTA